MRLKLQITRTSNSSVDETLYETSRFFSDTIQSNESLSCQECGVLASIVQDFNGEERVLCATCAIKYL